MSPRTRSSTRTEIKPEFPLESPANHVANTPRTAALMEAEKPNSSSTRKRKAQDDCKAADEIKPRNSGGNGTTRKRPKLKEHEQTLAVSEAPSREVHPAKLSRRRTPARTVNTKATVSEETPVAVERKSGKSTSPSPSILRKALLIREVMDKLYPDPPIPLDHRDNFTLLCGVLLSAQTTDAQVNEVTKKLFKVAPDPLRLSKMSQPQVQGIIRSVGLAPTKAKHLIALSQQLLERFNGQVPSTHEELQSLPGVGRKTASVVMAQAFGKDAFPVDTHIHRLALRWGLTRNEKNANKVEEDLMAVFPKESWSKLHLQFIYFGREHCQARTHTASSCPVCSWIKKDGPGAPQKLSDIECLERHLASPTPPRKSSKNTIVYTERLLEMEQFKMKIKPEG